MYIHPAAEPFTTPLAGLQAQHPNKRLVVGAAIISSVLPYPETNDATQRKRKVLIVYRAPHDTAFPALYELPGGGSEPEDGTLIETLVRETLEETGLRLTRVEGVFEGFEYETKKGRSVQFNFLVRVEEFVEREEGRVRAEVKLCSDEHDAYAWVGVEDVKELGKRYGLSGDMEVCVRNAIEGMARME